MLFIHIIYAHTDNMDSSILYALMVAIGIFLAILPFGVFIGLTQLLSANADDGRLLVVLFLAAAVIMFGTSLGSFALIQKNNCGSVKNMTQVATNAGIATAIQTFVLFLAWLITPLRNIIMNLFPTELDASVRNALGYSYYGFWGGLFGIAIGGTFSAVC
jgi:hypothetical protein